VVLVGDAAGCNDPIIGQGLSNTYRHVGIVSELLRGSDGWSAAMFAPYAEERRERMRRLRFAAALTAALESEFGPDARDRRHAHHLRAAVDPNTRAHVMAAMAGPDALPVQVFTPEYWNQALAGPQQDATA
jgi:2-polyprenyl-6-methoxyphenol hydroxylase-like FAD-dependent oxidoreductase